MKRKYFLKQVKESRCILFFVLAFLFVNCQKNKIDDDLLVRVYVENIVFEESHQQNTIEYTKQKEEIFKRNNISQKDFEEAMMKMKDDKNRWDAFFKKADALADDLKKSGTIK